MIRALFRHIGHDDIRCLIGLRSQPFYEIGCKLVIDRENKQYLIVLASLFNQHSRNFAGDPTGSAIKGRTKADQID